MKAGPKPMPTALKIATGNRGKRPLPEREPQPTVALPVEPPDWLDDYAKECWARLHANLTELGLSARCDTDAAAAYCQTYSVWRMATQSLCDDGLLFERGNGAIAARPEVAIANTAVGTLLKYQAEFGLTPAARTRVSVPNAKKQEGKDRFFADAV